MGENDIRALDSAVRGIYTILGKIAENAGKTFSVIVKLPELLTTISEVLRKGFHGLKQAQGQMLIISKTAELDSCRGLMELQKQVLVEKEHYLEEDVNKLNARYESIDHELDANFRNLIMNLDGHVINLYKEYYDQRAGRSFENAIPFLDALVKYYLDCASIRSDSVENEGLNACESINNFISKRNAFMKDIDQYKIKMILDNGISCPLPFAIIENDKGEIKYLMPSDFKIAQNDIVCVQQQGSGSVNAVDLQKDNSKDKIQWRYVTTADKENMHQDLDGIIQILLPREKKTDLILNELHSFINKLEIQVGEIK